MSRADIDNQPEDDDLVWGAAAIGRVIGRTERQVFYLAERRLLPVRSVGRQLVGSRRRLLAHLAREQIHA